VNRSTVLGRLQVVSGRRQIKFRVLRWSYGHEVWTCGAVAFAVPRRRQLSDGVVRHIRLKVEPVLGEGWWRK
jgi:hypothetical protein